MSAAPEFEVTFTGEIHSYADRWPMRPADEIEEMAESIRARRQRLPIILTPDGVLVDGRNRLRACELAGIEPWFEVDGTLIDEDEIVAYIWDANGDRRNGMSKGQLALLATICPGLVVSDSENAGVSLGYAGMARTIHKWCPDDTIEAAIAGTLPFDTAYTTARQIKATEQADEIARKKAEKEAKEQAERDARLLADLRANRPDLAELVDEERLPLGEALRLRAADREKERKREAAKAEKIRQRNLDFHLIFDGIEQLKHRVIFEEVRDNYHPIGSPITADAFREAAELLLALADDWTPAT
jgi:hypothetical protein